MSIRCAGGGRFIGFADIKNSRACLHFEPASHFGPEINEWLCAKCHQTERVSQLSPGEWLDAADGVGT